MAESLVYRNALLYELVMIALYGRHYAARYRTIAEWIPDGATVLDLCCGPGILYTRYLKAKGVDYTGLDINPRFTARLSRHGGHGIVWDVHSERPLPAAETVVMQASLYQFLPDPSAVVRRMLAAARTQVIIAEPIRNLSTSRLPLVAALARRRTDAGLGARAERFDERSLDAFFERLDLVPMQRMPIPGGRELVYLFAVTGASSARKDNAAGVGDGPTPAGPDARSSGNHSGWDQGSRALDRQER